MPVFTRKMSRTQAQAEAFERDGGLCIWHLWRYEMRLFATDVHHIARRGEGRDVKELCASLCRGCHGAHHSAHVPTTAQLVEMMLELYGLDLKRDFPLFFRGL